MSAEQDIRSQIEGLQKEVFEKQKEMAKLKHQLPPETVQDYAFATDTGTVKLSELFGDKDDLIVVHNMGKSCAYCTLWADGFVGLHDHIKSRSAFVVSSPDAPHAQQEFANGRGWPFRMVSGQGSSFIKDMGFEFEQDGQTYYSPGYSTFKKQPDGAIQRLAIDYFGPGDVYNGLWHMFDLLADGAKDWQPKYNY